MRTDASEILESQNERMDRFEEWKQAQGRDETGDDGWHQDWNQVGTGPVKVRKRKRSIEPEG